MIGVFCNPEMVAEAINTATNSMVSIQCVDTDADTANGGTSTLLVTKSKRQAYSYTPQPSLAFTSNPKVTNEPTPVSVVSGGIDTTVSITVHPVVLVPPSSSTTTANYTKTVSETVYEIVIEPSSTLTVTAMITNDPSSSAPDKTTTETESYDMLNPFHLTFPPDDHRRAEISRLRCPSTSRQQDNDPGAYLDVSRVPALGSPRPSS